MNKNIQTQNTVSPILTLKEKRRIHQISESFFKGSGEFFVLYNESINKTVDTDIIKSNFMEHYEDAIKQVKDNIKNKQEDLQVNVTKNNFHDKLMNFIIVLELAIIAATKLPVNLSNLQKLGDSFVEEFNYITYKLKNGGMDGVEYLANLYSSTFNPTRILERMLNSINPLIYYSYRSLIFGLDYFLNNTEDNAFLTCLGELASFIGSTASGAIGLILSMFGLGTYTAANKRPNLMHFLRYGTNPYMVAQRMENEIQSAIDKAEDNTIFSLFSSDASIGYQYATGGWVGLDDDDDGNELPEAKKLLTNFQNFRIEAAEQSNKKYRANSVFGVPNIFETKEYQKMEKSWNDVARKEFDLGSTSSIQFQQLLINHNSVNLSELNTQRKIIRTFYENNKGKNNHPYAKRICDEIDRYDLLDTKMRQRARVARNHYTIEFIIFAPAVIYAIIQYEHTQKRDVELISTLDYRLEEMDRRLRMLNQNQNVEELKELKIDYDNGLISTENVIIKLTSLLSFDKPLNSLRNINFEDILTCFLDFYEIITKSERKLYNVFQEVKYNTFDIRELDQEILLQSIQTSEEETQEKYFRKSPWISRDQLILSIGQQAKILREKNIELWERRIELLFYLAETVEALNPEVLYPKN